MLTVDDKHTSERTKSKFEGPILETVLPRTRWAVRRVSACLVVLPRKPTCCSSSQTSRQSWGLRQRACVSGTVCHRRVSAEWKIAPKVPVAGAGNPARQGKLPRKGRAVGKACNLSDDLQSVPRSYRCPTQASEQFLLPVLIAALALKVAYLVVRPAWCEARDGGAGNRQGSRHKASRRQVTRP